MDINAFIKAERQTKSPCCGARIAIDIRRSSTERVAAVYECLKCSRLHVVDSRDEEK